MCFIYPGPSNWNTLFFPSLQFLQESLLIISRPFFIVKFLKKSPLKHSLSLPQRIEFFKMCILLDAFFIGHCLIVLPTLCYGYIYLLSLLPNCKSSYHRICLITLCISHRTYSISWYIVYSVYTQVIRYVSYRWLTFTFKVLSETNYIYCFNFLLLNIEGCSF